MTPIRITLAVIALCIPSSNATAATNGSRWPPGSILIETLDGDLGEFEIGATAAFTDSLAIEVTHGQGSTSGPARGDPSQDSKRSTNETIAPMKRDKEMDVDYTAIALRWHDELRPGGLPDSLTLYLFASAGVGTYDIGPERRDFGVNGRFGFGLGLPGAQDARARYAFEIGGRFHYVNTPGSNTGLFDVIIGARVFFGRKDTANEVTGSSSEMENRVE